MELLLLKGRAARSLDPSQIPPLKVVMEAVEEASAQGRKDIELVLRYQILDLENPISQAGSDFQKKLTDLITNAKDLGLTRTTALLLNGLAYRYFYEGQYHKSMNHLTEAYKDLEAVFGPKDPDVITLKNDLASTLEYLGDIRKSREIYKELIPEITGQYRYLSGIATYNFAAMLKKDEERAEAVELLKGSIQVLESVGEPVVSLLAKKALAENLLKQGSLEEGLLNIKAVINSLESQKVFPDALADSYRVQAGLLLALDKPQAASESLVQADIEILKNNQKYQGDLAILRSKILQAKGQLRDSIAESLRATELFRKVMLEDRENQIAKLSVQFGLELEEKKSALLKKENQLQRQKIRENELIFQGLVIVAGLGIFVIVLLFMSNRLLRRNAAQKRYLENIFDNIEEGIITIGPRLKTDTDLSPYLENILGIKHEQLREHDVLQLILDRSDISGEERSIVKSTLDACIGDEKLSWELNSNKLPHEVTIDQGKRVLALHWQAILTRQEKISSVLLAIRDITEHKKLSRDLDLANKRNKLFIKIGEELLNTDVSATKGLVKEIRDTWAGLKSRILQNQPSKEDLRTIHTWKGNGRHLGLKKLTEKLHDLESALSGQGDLVTIESQFSKHLAVYSDFLERISKLSSEEKTPSPWWKLAQAEEDARVLCQENGLLMKQISFENQISRWSKDLLEIFQVMLIHGVSNAIDHGFVRSKTDNRDVSLIVSGYESAECFQLILVDNGAGLAKKFKDEPDRIFEDGATSSETVGAHSGRGVGLSAVKGAVEDLGGQIAIADRPPQGTQLTITIPKEKVMDRVS